ncbi:hypothetical protein H2198_003373 [Neophaeococcomyces mojaviensis]|uniref:Uncharacterized protein n=1 Tax=Neophaeococcomyces mojaviensis TaxID=3383035 RepID=A0ACC3AC04_9EURO|nr:hypothetical protein H2198_003373 [Knufia sp. JES_112]
MSDRDQERCPGAHKIRLYRQSCQLPTTESEDVTRPRYVPKPSVADISTSKLTGSVTALEGYQFGSIDGDKGGSPSANVIITTGLTHPIFGGKSKFDMQNANDVRLPLQRSALVTKRMSTSNPEADLCKSQIDSKESTVAPSSIPTSTKTSKAFQVPSDVLIRSMAADATKFRPSLVFNGEKHTRPSKLVNEIKNPELENASTLSGQPKETFKHKSRKSFHLDAGELEGSWLKQQTLPPIPSLSFNCRVPKRFSHQGNILASTDSLSSKGEADSSSLEASSRPSEEQSKLPLEKPPTNVDLLERNLPYLTLADITSTMKEHTPGQSSSSKSTANTASNEAQTNTSNRSSKHSSHSHRTKINNFNDDESDKEENDGGDEDEAKDVGGQDCLLFACPFSKVDGYRSQACVKKVLRDIPALKQHLERVHKAADWYCFRCHAKFVDEAQYEAHLRTNTCAKKTYHGPGLIKRDVWNESIHKRTRGQDPKEKWYDIFKSIFPDLGRPESPFQSLNNQEDVLLHMTNLLNALSVETVQQMILDLTPDRRLRATLLPQATRRIFNEALKTMRRTRKTSGDQNGAYQDGSSSDLDIMPLDEYPLVDDFGQLSNYVNNHLDGFGLIRDASSTSEDPPTSGGSCEEDQRRSYMPVCDKGKSVEPSQHAWSSGTAPSEMSNTPLPMVQSGDSFYRTATSSEHYQSYGGASQNLFPEFSSQQSHQEGIEQNMDPSSYFDFQEEYVTDQRPQSAPQMTFSPPLGFNSTSYHNNNTLLAPKTQFLVVRPSQLYSNQRPGYKSKKIPRHDVNNRT